MKTAIMTDTNSGMTAGKCRELGIFLLPMPVVLDGESYFEGVNITAEQLYGIMEAQSRHISTSQPAPSDIVDMWNAILADGYDEIVHIPMTSGLSGSCQSAMLLAEDFGGKVHVVDNHRISVTQMESVLEAKKMADTGFRAAEIKAYLEETAYQASIYLTVASLKYLQMGGRLSSSAAMLGTLLNIKPILSIQGEKIDAFAKVRGMQPCEKKMIETLRDDIARRFADVPPERLHIATAGTLRSEEEITHWRSLVQSAFPEHEVYYDPLPCSIACHVGPDAKGIGTIVVR